MEIVSYGHIVPKEIFCNGCGAVLRYLPKDVKFHNNARKHKNYITCPVCSKNIFIDISVVSKNGYVVFSESSSELEA